MVENQQDRRRPYRAAGALRAECGGNDWTATPRTPMETTPSAIARTEIKRLQTIGPAPKHISGDLFHAHQPPRLAHPGRRARVGYLLGPGSRMWYTDPERFTNRVEVCGPVLALR